MTDKEVLDRCSDLDAFMQEVYTKRATWPPAIAKPTLALLQLDAAQVRPARLALASNQRKKFNRVRGIGGGG